MTTLVDDSGISTVKNSAGTYQDLLDIVTYYRQWFPISWNDPVDPTATFSLDDYNTCRQAVINGMGRSWFAQIPPPVYSYQTLSADVWGKPVSL